MTFIIPGLLFSLLAHSALAAFDGKLNPMGCGFDDMQRFYMKELGIDEDVFIKHVRKRMPDPRTRGFTKPLRGKKRYLIAMASGLEPSEIRITLAHELVHVRQLENGEIHKKEFKKAYMERSFEDEAFRLSMPLAIKFYTQHDCQGISPTSNHQKAPLKKQGQ